MPRARSRSGRFSAAARCRSITGGTRPSGCPRSWLVVWCSKNNSRRAITGCATRAEWLAIPEDCVEHPQAEDAGDDKQVVTDQLAEADARGDLGPAGDAEQQRGGDARGRGEH